MNRITANSLLALFISVGLQNPLLSQTSDWRLGGTNPAAYTLDANGRATDPGGATISLRSAADTSATFGSVSSQLSADALRGRRVTISAELRTSGVSGGASVWLRVDQGATPLLLDNGSGQSLRGDTDWTKRSVSLPVPAEASSVVFGLLLQGRGAVSVRGLRLEVGEPIAPNAPPNAAAKAVLDEAFAIAKKSSLRRSEIVWDVVEPKVRALAAGAETSADVYPAIRYLLAQLGDHHSFLMPPSQSTQFRNGGAQNPAPEVRGLPRGVGYISMPGYSGAEPNAARTYAKQMHDSMANTIASVSCGWVVDLRPNTGGNMWPMLAGLKPFLGGGGLGTFVSPSGPGPSWVAGQGLGVEPPSTLATLESAWVAVITGPRTASSGEAVTIAFRGRPRTRSFGQPTAGLSTANGTFPLSDGATIFLTTAIDADRTGQRYGDKVSPDVLVDATGTDDDPIPVAIEWLRQSAGCDKGQ